MKEWSLFLVCIGLFVVISTPIFNMGAAGYVGGLAMVALGGYLVFKNKGRK